MDNSIQLYESIINETVGDALKKLDEFRAVYKDKLDPVDASAILSSYLQTVLEKGLRHYRKSEHLAFQIEVVNQVISHLAIILKDEEINESLIIDDQLLRGISEKIISRERFMEMIPKTSVARSSLFTGNEHEPPVYQELKREIASADQIDLLISFIKYSGLRLIYNDLVEHTKTKKLRVITTSYMGATDYKAVKMLSELPNTEVKISYDVDRTRLHAKAYYFYRKSGFSTAYIGSSNLSKAALSEGTEWNLKISEYSSFELIQKYRVTFETYWNTDEFQLFNPKNSIDIKRLRIALAEENNKFANKDQQYFFDLIPYAFQQAILDKLQIEREVYGSYKNLIISATGTGKTMVTAFDFKQFHIENPNAKLLFLAHREEILYQSLTAFRGVLKDSNFGELWVGKDEPVDYSHIFASIQTLNSHQKFLKFEPDFFDYIVLDETHHVAANSYRKIIDYFKPKILLGLTATPERMDNIDILADFNNRIAYEIRLREAIERNLLCPFHYFGISDEIDLSNLKWQRGFYDTKELELTYIGNEQRNNEIFRAIEQYVVSIDKMKALGFCVSKDHANYMSRLFNDRGIPATNLDSDSTKEHRKNAKAKLLKGDIKIIFVVDLYNEGVDIPEIDVVIFLRPTESATIFIQQLGRGLRLFQNKDVLTVLDFIGQAHKNYDYRIKFQSLLGRSQRSIGAEISEGFLSLPINCHILLEKVARDRILKSIETAYLSNRRLTRMMIDFKLNTVNNHNLLNFLKYYQIDILELYHFTTFTELFEKNFSSDNHSSALKIKSLHKIMSKIAQINDFGLLGFLKRYFLSPYKLKNVSDIRMATMFYYSIYSEEWDGTIQSFMMAIYKHSPKIINEILEVVTYSLENIDHLPKRIFTSNYIPLELHANYSTSQVFAALGENTINNTSSFREGVRYFADLNIDAFFVTLNKSEKHFKESTRYVDYAINDELFYWQSQSRTSTNSVTGQRYINQQNNGSQVLLFVREEMKDVYGNTEVYRCLGLAKYVSHQGSSPISITYKLEDKMPSEIFKAANNIVRIV